MVAKETDLIKRPFTFLSSWRSLPPYELLSYLLMYASVPMLAFGIQSYDSEIIKIIVFTVICLYSGFFAALIWNDITDADIDAMAHPDRPIPSGRISKSKFFAIALVFSALTFIFAFLVSPLCFFLVGFAALFVTFHDKFLKKKMKLPAYSEIFTPIQWIVVAIFGFFAIWTALPQSSSVFIDMRYLGSISTETNAVYQMLILVVFVYFADNAHDLAEGIVDVEGDRIHGVKTYATSFGVKNAARISFIWFLIAGLMGIILFLKTVLSYVFLVSFICIWIYIMSQSFRLLTSKKEDMKKIGAIVGRKGFDFFLFSFNFMFLDLLVQLIIHHL
jgi:geranylgeranylglycerol-phosphate geranylgeranyltransferase